MGDAVVAHIGKDSYDVEVVVVGGDYAGATSWTHVAHATMPGGKIVAGPRIPLETKESFLSNGTYQGAT